VPPHRTETLGTRDAGIETKLPRAAKVPTNRGTQAWTCRNQSRETSYKGQYLWVSKLLPVYSAQDVQLSLPSSVPWFPGLAVALSLDGRREEVRHFVLIRMGETFLTYSHG
jgi:hypothetical protein